MKKNSETFLLILLWIAIGVMGRLIPHLPNVTPLTSLCLVAGALFSRRLAVTLMLIIAALSNVLLAYTYGYAVWGWWSLFTYSGFIAMIGLGTRLSSELPLTKTWMYTLGSSLGFWLWTNFGTWLVSGMSPQSLAGFTACYVAGLPFLRNAMLGTTTWLLILLGGIYAVRILTAPRAWQSLSKDTLI